MLNTKSRQYIRDYVWFRYLPLNLEFGSHLDFWEIKFTDLCSLERSKLKCGMQYALIKGMKTSGGQCC